MLNGYMTQIITRNSGPWSSKEDEMCRSAVIEVLRERHQLNEFLVSTKLPVGFSWKQVEKIMLTRKSKQCRERWMNHLAPGIKFTNWSEAEDQILSLLFSKHGPKWNLFSKHLLGRPENQIKMRWRVLNRRRMKETRTLAPNPKRTKLQQLENEVKALISQ